MYANRSSKSIEDSLVTPDTSRRLFTNVAGDTPSPFQEMAVDTGPVRLNLAVGPNSGPPLVCIHGVGRSWRDFVPMLPGLIPYWQVLCPDLRGHGKSGRTGGRYLVRDYLSDVGSLLAQIGRPVILFGHSLGALLSLAAAAEWPQQVRAVVAEDPPSEDYLARIFDTSYTPLFETMQQLAGTSQSTAAVARALGNIVVSIAEGTAPVRLADVRDGASLRFSARCLRDLDRDVYTPVLARGWLDGLDFPALLSRVTCPVLLLRGDETQGGMLPRADADTMLERLVDGTLVEFSAIGHQIHWLDCGNVLRVTMAFLESV
jgi:pimeloyl-ACP methyl ester carboxylesterase